MVEIIDLGGYIESGQPVFPGHPDTQVWTARTHEEFAYRGERRVGEETESIRRHAKAKREEGAEATPLVQTVQVSEHGPTHIDSFNHLDPTDDRTIDRMNLDLFYGPGIALDVSHVDYPEYITVDDLESELEATGLSIREGDHLLLHTGHREEHYAVGDDEAEYAYTFEYPGLSEDAAYWLGEAGVSNIGADAPSIDHGDASERMEFPSHDMGAEYDVLNVENLANVDAVAGERFTFCAIPLKIRDGTGSPIRPIAIMDGGESGAAVGR